MEPMKDGSMDSKLDSPAVFATEEMGEYLNKYMLKVGKAYSCRLLTDSFLAV